MPLIEARHVSYSYRKGSPLAVDDVSLKLDKASTLGVVGASGSGKSTLGELVGGLCTPTSGSVLFEGVDIRTLSRADYRRFRSRVQYVFQDPQGSMDATFTVRKVLEEPLEMLERGLSRSERAKRCERALDLVGLDGGLLDKKPRELSGGQCQRVAIARAFLPHPDVVICDECTSALDVLVQAQILNLLRDIQEKTGCSYVFISHNAGVVDYMADEVIVMKRGSVVESGPTKRVFTNPENEYTRALLASSAELAGESAQIMEDVEPCA